MWEALVLSMFVSSAAMSCSKDTNPAAPSTVQVGGVWVGNVTTSAVSGGECFAAAFQETPVGIVYEGMSVSITQSGANLTATGTATPGGERKLFRHRGAIEHCSEVVLVHRVQPTGLGLS
jgi:hypothetical protein